MKTKTKRYYYYYLARCFSLIISILPVRVAVYLGGLISKLAYALVGQERKKTLENLRLSFKEKSGQEIEKIARGVFSNLGKNIAELFQIYKLKKHNLDAWITIRGKEKVDAALRKGNGAVLLTAHFGNWELISIYFKLLGYEGNVIGRKLRFRGFDEFLNKIRASKGVYVIYRDESPKKMLRVLRNNGIIGMLADQDVDSLVGVFVDFFGRPAYTPIAPVAIALASKAELIPCFIIRKNHAHELIIEEPIELERRPDKHETLKVNTEKWSRVVESYIRRYPEQWVWMHRRWKTKPEFVKREA